MRDWPGACVERLVASFGASTGTRSDSMIILFKNKYTYAYITKSLDVYCGVLGTLFVLLDLLAAVHDKSGTIRVFQEKRFANG